MFKFNLAACLLPLLAWHAGAQPPGKPPAKPLPDRPLRSQSSYAYGVLGVVRQSGKVVFSWQSDAILYSSRDLAGLLKNLSGQDVPNASEKEVVQHLTGQGWEFVRRAIEVRDGPKYRERRAYFRKVVAKAEVTPPAQPEYGTGKLTQRITADGDKSLSCSWEGDNNTRAAGRNPEELARRLMPQLARKGMSQAELLSTLGTLGYELMSVDVLEQDGQVEWCWYFRRPRVPDRNIRLGK